MLQDVQEEIEKKEIESAIKPIKKEKAAGQDASTYAWITGA